MADLIERNALLSEELSSYADDYYGLERLIRSIPAVDAEPVKHGHWVEVKDYYTCSVCGYQPPDDGGMCESYWQNAMFTDDCRFCPNCGAKMDEEVKKDD